MNRSCCAMAMPCGYITCSSSEGERCIPSPKGEREGEGLFQARRGTPHPCPLSGERGSRGMFCNTESARVELKYSLISVDDHVQEHPEVWTQRMSRATWGER